MTRNSFAKVIMMPAALLALAVTTYADSGLAGEVVGLEVRQCGGSTPSAVTFSAE